MPRVCPSPAGVRDRPRTGKHSRTQSGEARGPKRSCIRVSPLDWRRDFAAYGGHGAMRPGTMDEAS